MAVREQNGIETVQPGAHGLLAKVRRGVNDYVLTVAREQQRRSQAFIARIGGTANAAGAAERGYTHRCAGPKNRDF